MLSLVTNNGNDVEGKKKELIHFQLVITLVREPSGREELDIETYDTHIHTHYNKHKKDAQRMQNTYIRVRTSP